MTEVKALSPWEGRKAEGQAGILLFGAWAFCRLYCRTKAILVAQC